MRCSRSVSDPEVPSTGGLTVKAAAAGGHGLHTNDGRKLHANRCRCSKRGFTVNAEALPNLPILAVSIIGGRIAQSQSTCPTHKRQGFTMP